MIEHEYDKPLFWIGSSLNDLKDCPKEVQDFIGYALDWAQRGGKSPAAKPLQGFGNAGVLEIVDDFNGNTYRAVYTVRFAQAVYTLHVFQEKITQRNFYTKTGNRFGQSQIKKGRSPLCRMDR